MAEGRKRHILTETNGMLTAAIVHEANIQDRDGAVPLLTSTRQAWPWLRHVFADGGYPGSKLQETLGKAGRCILEIVERSDTAQGFELLRGDGWSNGSSPGRTATEGWRSISFTVHGS